LAIDAETRHRRLLICAFAATAFLIHLATDGRYGYFRDELYFLDAARHLDWGYVDFAPLTAWLLRLNGSAFGDSLHALRLLPAISAAVKIILTSLIAIELGADMYGIALACLCVLAAPVYLVIDNQFAANTFEPLFWMGCVYVLMLAIKSDRPRILIWFGLLAGLGLENKISMLFFCAAIFIGVLLTSTRTLVRSPWVIGAMLIAATIFLPTLLWQSHRDWPTLQMLANVRRRHQSEDLSALQFVGHQLMMLGPASAVVWIPGLWFLLRGEAGPRVFGFAYVVLLAIMTRLGAKDYYLAPMYPLLFAAGGAFWSGIFVRDSASRWFRYAIPSLIVIGGLLAAPLALPLLSPENLVRYEEALGLNNPRSQTGQEGVLPEHFGDEFGWPEMAAAVARVYHRLSPEDREKAAIFAKNYGEAGAIDFFGPPLGLPPAISGHQNYWYWGPRGYTGEVIIALQYSREELLNMGCASVEDGPVANHPYSMAEEHFQITICRGLRPPLPRQWPGLKRWN
jgi:4-amino-4-deoxy-L-arabinose transferase-like glycosyltransferase